MRDISAPTRRRCDKAVPLLRPRPPLVCSLLVRSHGHGAPWNMSAVLDFLRGPTACEQRPVSAPGGRGSWSQTRRQQVRHGCGNTNSPPCPLFLAPPSPPPGCRGCRPAHRGPQATATAVETASRPLLLHGPPVGNRGGLGSRVRSADAPACGSRPSAHLCLSQIKCYAHTTDATSQACQGISTGRQPFRCYFSM